MRRAPSISISDGNGKRRVETRGSPTARGYGRAWEAVRRAYLRRFPLCQDCTAGGRVTLAIDVHHVRAKRDGGTDDAENLMGLCRSCHSVRTVRGE